jgi:hypothetical protein
MTQKLFNDVKMYLEHTSSPEMTAEYVKCDIDLVYKVAKELGYL